MGEYKIHVSMELYELINTAQEKALNENKVSLPKYEYPNNVITSATIQKIAKWQTLKIKDEDCYFIRRLDNQNGKAIFGGGFLLSEKAAAKKADAEKAAGEKAAVHSWKLSEREKEIIQNLG